MSRSYYEWMTAKQAWHEQQNLRISSLPYPDANSIVYNRDSSNPFWERRRQHALSLIPSSYNLNFDTDAITQFINNAATVEEQKEEEFLNKFFPDRGGQDSITAFNILFQSREQLDKINERLNNVFSKKSSTNMAPNLSAIFGSYLERELNHAIQAAMGKFNPNMTADAMMAQFDACFEQAVMKASEKMVNITNDKGFGLGEEWKPVNDALNAANPRAKQLFIAALKQAIGTSEEKINQLLSDIWSQQAEKAAGKRKKITYRTLLANNLTIGKRTAQIGGTVVEQALAAIANVVNGISGSNGGISYAMQAEGVLGNMVKTDSFMLFSEDVNINVAAIAEQLNQMLSNSTSLDDARVILNKFNDQYKEQMDELYSVFVNAKNYTMGSSYHDYTDEKNGTFEELPQFLSDAGIPIGNAQEFLSFVYNTSQGAIWEAARGYVEETTINALKAAAAKIMFDDYQTYGQGSGHGIHMYYLSGKYIPSSYVFRGMAEAASGMRAKTMASVSLLGSIEDNGPNWGFEGSDADYKEALFKHWAEEYERARAAARWSVSFTLYMKNILSSSL